MNFYKMQACGNDFIFFDEYNENIDYKNLATSLCERRVSVGADGLIVLKKNGNGNFFFLFYNADGTLGKMCGNGLRCYLLLAYKLGLIQLNEEVCVETLAGNMYGKVSSYNQNDGVVDENLGFPEYDCKKLKMNTSEETWINKEVEVENIKYKATCLELGAFHMVTFMKPLETSIAKKMHELPLFMDRINVNFAEIIDRRNIILQT